MKKSTQTVLAAGLAAFVLSAGARPKPSPMLQERIKAGIEVYGLVHWGLNTFTCHEVGSGCDDPKWLNPDAFDADQIVGACKDGGLQGLVIVAKHHDGFCLWPTKTTDYNIAKSPFRGGKGDYVKEMEQACRRHGLKFGVYCSAWDRNNADYGNPKYIETFRAQLAELLSGDYGELFMMWFDDARMSYGYYGGARTHRKVESDYFQFDGTFRLVRKLQPKICIFNGMDGAEIRCVGNERGELDDNSSATICSSTSADYVKYCNVGNLTTGSFFRQPECDLPLRMGWFYHEKEKHTVRCGEYLMQRYLNSVGNGATMDIGIAPDHHGRVAPEDIVALKRFNALRKEFFANEVTTGPYNVVVLTEDVSEGEFVNSWKVSAAGQAVVSGTAVGIKRIRVLKTPADAAATTLDYTVLEGRKEDHPVRMRLFRVDQKTLDGVMNAKTDIGHRDAIKMWCDDVRPPRRRRRK